MDGLLVPVVEALLVAAVSIAGTLLFLERSANSRTRVAQRQADQVLQEAEQVRRDAEITAKDEAIRLRGDLDRELTNRRKEIERIEKRIEQKEENIDRKASSIEQRETAVRRQEQSVIQLKENFDKERDHKLQEIDDLRNRRLGELERIAQLTAEEARQELVAEVESEARAMAARRLHEIEQEINAEAERRSRKVLATTIQRIATDYVAESTVSVVPLPSDEMKGRIIGREGRNIRALEQATGVDLIVDDTPEVITVSAYDPLRRELARRVLQKLLQDGRIHPTRIEDVVNKTQSELDGTIREEGERVAYEANVVGLHPDLIKLLGRLKFRTSYGQNVLAHSLETSVISGALAAEIGADIN
ncbi:MAG TPA: Rnase Y domain-containing protein, partial [Thermomicrobiales bacterium]|nr:Rnase Y domain-containing protein [Thermomicrobiales bacterium]